MMQGATQWHMSSYTTSEEHVPEDPEAADEVTLQVTDTESREIFWTSAHLAKDPDELAAPEPLTVVRGPHENIEEEWYIELTGDAEDTVDTDLLRTCIEEAQEADLLNARSVELRAMVEYLVETGEYESRSEAVRSLLSAQLAEAHPDVVDEFVDLRTQMEREQLVGKLEDG